jgi:dihydrofolate reductase
MRKLIVSEFVTLDGVMEAPGGEPSHPHSGWVFDFMSKEQEQYKLEETLEAEALLLGRVTYEGFAAAWPERGGEFADKMNSMPKYVVSSTLSEPLDWDNSTLLGGDAAEAVAKLKEGEGGPILVAGSRTLVHTLLERGLVDELRLMVFPVAIGSGIRVFPESREKIVMRLTDSRSFGSGVQVLTYEPVAA